MNPDQDHERVDVRRPIPIAVAVALMSFAATGDDLLECVSPDVQHGLLFWRPADQAATISSEVPSEIASLSVPSEFRWIANAARTSSATGAFKTTGDPATALDEAVSALAADGWETEGNIGPTTAFGGRQSRTVCRDQRTLSLAAWQVEDVSYVTYHVSSNAASSVCRAGARLGQMPLDPYMPRLDFSALDPNAFSRGGGGGGGSESMARSMQVTLDADIDAVASRLARQLEAQGWLQEASWSGPAAAGSEWMHRTDDQRSFAGALDVINLGDSLYHVEFALRELVEE